MTDDHDPRSDDDILAAEYALGLLDPATRASVEERMKSDPAFEQRVVRWEALGDRWSSAAPSDPDWSPDDLWNRMETAFVPPGPDRALPQPANDTGGQAGTRRSGYGWQFGSLAASLLAVTFVGLYLGERAKVDRIGTQLELAQAQGAIDRSAIRIAQVSATDGNPLLSVMYEAKGGKLTARVATLAKDGLVPELWVIGPDGKPRSLGQSAGGSVFVIELTDQMRADIAAGSSIAISLEEASPEPSAQPTAERILGAAQLAPIS